MNIDKIYIGQNCSIHRSFTAEEVKQFASLSLDTNPLHTDATFASKSRFGQLIVPGMLSASLFSAIIGTRLPGDGSIYLSQNLSFRKPVYPNREVVATVTVTSMDRQKNRVTLSTTLHDNNGDLLIDGTALIQLQ